MADSEQHGTIRRISATATHRICSGQVIVDLATAVKELVENALDANATTIEVRLQDYGIKLLEVADNGSGISAHDYEHLALKYTTSKIYEFTDLLSLSTYGFRGEALSSLCAMADLTVVTRTAEQQVGSSLEYDREGCLVKKTLMARAPGTTVALRNLFAGMPVRYKELQRNVRREFGKMVAVLQAYALICTHVRFSVSNQVTGGSRSLVLSTQGPRPIAAPPLAGGGGQGASLVPDLKVLHTNIITILGSKVADTLEPIELEVTELGGNIKGYVSKGTITKSSSEAVRQFLFINSRPVDFPRIIKMLNETYRSLSSAINQTSKPTAVLNICLPPDSYDINVTPDKRKVLMQFEDQLVNSLKEALEQLWEPSRYTYSVSNKNNNNATRAGAGGSQQLLAGRTFTQRPLSHFTQALAPSQPAEVDEEEVVATQHDTQPPDTQEQEAAGTQQEVLDTQQQLGLPEQASPSQHRKGDTNIPAGRIQAGESPFKQRALGGVSPSQLHTQHESGGAAGLSPPMAPAGLRHDMDAGGTSNQEAVELPEADSRTDQLQTVDVELGSDNDGAAHSTDALTQQNDMALTEPSARGLQASQHFQLPLVQSKATALSQQQVDAEEESITIDHDDETHCMQGDQEIEPHHTQHGKRQRLASPLSPGKLLKKTWNEMSHTPADRHPSSSIQGTQQEDPTAAQEGGEMVEEEDEEPPSARTAAAFKLHSFMQPPAGKVTTVRANHAPGIADGVAPPRPRHPFLALAERAAAVINDDITVGSSAGIGVEDTNDKTTEEPNHHKVANGRTIITDSAATPGTCKNRQRTEQADTSVTPTVSAKTSKTPRTPAGTTHVVVQVDMSRLQAVTQARIAKLQAAVSVDDDMPTQNASQQVEESGGPAAVPASQPVETGSIQYDNQEVSSPVKAAKRRRRFTNASLQSDSGGAVAADNVAAGSDSTQLPQPPPSTSTTRADREAAAERELERVFDKAEFTDMQVIGQFNLGFMLARLGKDIFIIDQHAADEKRTFEKLQPFVNHHCWLALIKPTPQATVVLNRQPLLVPRPMNLPYLDELIVRDHWETVFKRNGFDFKEDPATGSLMLAAVPYCKGVTFGMDDVRELISLIREGGTKLDSIQPSRIRSILASRACRSSIMIGKALDHRQMTKLVHSLAGLQAPWNCPHGRPTMRHACVLP